MLELIDLLQNIEGMHKEVLYGIFVYIHKVYDSHEYGRAQTIIEGYWGGPPGLPTPEPILVSVNHAGEG